MRTAIAWGDLRLAFLVPRDRAHDYVFGYSIVYDVSDRGGRQRRVVTMFPGTNWFDGKSIDRGGPFGPFIVPFGAAYSPSGTFHAYSPVLRLIAVMRP